MATGGEGYQTPALWQADGGKQLRTLGKQPSYGDVTGLALSGDGSAFAQPGSPSDKLP